MLLSRGILLMIARPIDWLEENGYFNNEHSKIKGESSSCKTKWISKC